MWESVGLVLGRGVSDAQHTWAVEEASKGSEEEVFINHILHHCTGDQLNTALIHLVDRRMWESVGLVLGRGVSDAQHAWVVEEASKTVEEEVFINHILHHCTGDQLNTVLLHLVDRRMWESVGLVLNRGVSDAQHMWAVEEASKTAEEWQVIEHILPSATIAQLESALSHLVVRHMWESVRLVLKKCVSETHYSWVAEEASKRADEQDFINHILPRCTGAQLNSALPHLVRRHQWKSLDLVLERGARAGMLVLESVMPVL
jgi:hypothetical protein